MKTDFDLIARTIQIAKESKENGNLPFGCLLVDKYGNTLLEGQNSINTDKDFVAHAEINLIREAGKKHDHPYLKDCTIYTTVEPCPMCVSAIYWSGIGKLVYGLEKKSYYDMVGRNNPDWVFEMSSREILKHGGRKLVVVGPVLQKEEEKKPLCELFKPFND